MAKRRKAMGLEVTSGVVAVSASEIIVVLKNVDIARLGAVKSEIKSSKEILSHVGHTIIDMLRLDERVNQIVAERLLGLVVGRESLELILVPRPELKHLRGGLNKVPLNAGAMESSVLGLTNKVVNTVAHLVEESDNLIVLQQRGLSSSGLGEVADKGSDGVDTLASLDISVTRSQVKVGSMAVLTRTGMQIKVEPTKEISRLASFRGIPDVELSNILVPGLLLSIRNLVELETKSLLIESKDSINSILNGEVVGNLLTVNLVLALKQDIGVKAVIPGVELAIKGETLLSVVLLLELKKNRKVFLSLGGETVSQIVQELLTFSGFLAMRSSSTKWEWVSYPSRGAIWDLILTPSASRSSLIMVLLSKPM